MKTVDATPLRPSASEAPIRTTTIEGIQVLRAVAALMVVLHHARASVPNAETWPAFGAAGVDIFFIISGFVMAHSTRLLAASGGAHTSLAAADEFLRRRIARVVPLYWIALLWTARRDLGDPAASVGLLKDFLFLPHANATYPDMLWPIMIQGWTLNYEMFFYALFAISLLVTRARTAVLIAMLLALVAIGAALTLGAPASSLTGLEGWAAARVFYTDNILLEFGFGVLLQRWTAAHRLPAWPRAVFVLLVAVGFVALALAHDQGPRGLTQGLPALLIVWAAIGAFAGLRLPSWERLADASYAIYLFHWASFGAVKPVAAWLAGGVATSWPAPLVATLLMGLHMLVAVVSGLLIHRWVERPVIRVAHSLLGLDRPRVRSGATA